MDITVALDRMHKRRDLKMVAGDEITLDVVVYEKDSDTAPVAVTNLTFRPWPTQDFAIPVGSLFTVPDQFPGRWRYRITGEIGGNTRTLCWGTLEIFGGDTYPYPLGNDYGWGWSWRGYPSWP